MSYAHLIAFADMSEEIMKLNPEGINIETPETNHEGRTARAKTPSAIILMAEIIA
jgi:hypothetical protein